MFNKKHSKISVERIRKAMTGKKKSKETMVKISETLSKKLNKQQNRYRAFLGHILSIYSSVSKYAKQWKLPIANVEEFKNWSIKDIEYEKLFNVWKDNDFNKFDIPVVMRGIKKNGFILDNLTWKRKGEYSWWGEDKALFDVIEKNLDRQQQERNKRTKEWQKKTREEWKQKRKKK